MQPRKWCHGSQRRTMSTTMAMQLGEAGASRRTTTGATAVDRTTDFRVLESSPTRTKGLVRAQNVLPEGSIRLQMRRGFHQTLPLVNQPTFPCGNSGRPQLQLPPRCHSHDHGTKGPNNVIDRGPGRVRMGGEITNVTKVDGTIDTAPERGERGKTRS
jgi:hypothetical protein